MISRATRLPMSGQAILNRHPVLRISTGISWAKLQFIESQAIVATMLRLKRDHDIPALPVHDSLIVPRSAYHVADFLMEKRSESPSPAKVPLHFKPSVPGPSYPGSKTRPTRVLSGEPLGLLRTFREASRAR